jgi:hypothetical protein
MYSRLGGSSEVSMGWLLFVGVVTGLATYLVLLGSLASGRDRGRTSSHRPERRVTTADPLALSTPRRRSTDIALEAQLLLYGNDASAPSRPRPRPAAKPVP